MNRNINIIIPSAEEEFNYIWSLLEQMQWFRENKYRIRIPDVKEFHIAAIYAPYSFRNGEKEYLQKLFLTKIFSEEPYKTDYDSLNAKSEDLGRILTLFNTWEQLCGFESWPEYKIKLTQYGPGGGYFIKEKLIKVLVNKVGGKLTVYQTVVHEMVHIGIEHIFVETFKLSQKEKETLVDWICKNHLNDFMPDYPIQAPLNEELLALLEGKKIEDIQEVLKSWKRESNP